MWGQAPSGNKHLVFFRIIPTRVGTRAITAEYNPINKDHPHACGDKEPVRHGCWEIVGSSPRVWGQVSVEGVANNVNRIIPTRVGTRIVSLCLNSVAKDHPHACGDKGCQESAVFVAKGSSPRVWGQAQSDNSDNFSLRIIPTRVGTRMQKRGYTVVGEDHPHACGDKTVCFGNPDSFIGSSPRVWGQGICVFSGVLVFGIIPTRVGTR